ncbi:MAG: YcaO-like family protein [Cyanobacteriota bacterium]|jgi:ribosomal protein S12 methylthiotransferase accessory factor
MTSLLSSDPGQAFADPSAPKGFRGSTHRACPPEDTLARITPHLALAGITRLADITGLDRVGIPVTLAIRPNARTVVGSTGKGPTLVAAQVSGAMEAIEMHHAEYAGFEVIEASLEDLQRQDRLLLDIHRIPTVRHQRLIPDAPLQWTTGEDVASGSPVLVPFSCVHLRPPRKGLSLARSPFQRSSNGLASGNNRLEAILAGMYELIERDAYALARALPGFWSRGASIVDLRALDLPQVAPLLAACAAADVMVMVLDMTSDLGVPAFAARLFDLAQPETGTAVGYGCHLDTEVALVRAITEAVQSRVVVQVAGSRDDTTKYERWTMGLFASEMEHARRLQAQARHVPEVRRAGRCFSDDFRLLLARLAAADLPRVGVVDMQEPPFPVAVVRVVIPGLEGICTFPSYSPGPRARARAAHLSPPL